MYRLTSVVTTIVLLAASPVFADEESEAAKIFFNKGVKLYKSDDFTGALVEFQKAYGVKEHYSVLYNIAQCLKGLERYSEALETFEQYLEEGGDEIEEERQEEVQGYVSGLYDVLSQLTLVVDQEEALIFLDGEKYGLTPHPAIIFLDAGSHTVRIEKDGFEPFEQELLLSRGEQFTLQVPLARVEEEGTPVPAKEREKIGPVPFYVLAGLTGALAVGFAVTGGLAIKKKKDFESCYRDEPDCWRPLKDDHRKLAIATDVLWPTALASLAATVVIAFFTDFHPDEKQAVLVPALGPGRADLVLRLRF